MLSKIKKYARDNNIELRYEEFKCQIKEFQKKQEEKYSFIFVVKPSMDLKKYIDKYKKKAKKERKYAKRRHLKK